MIDLDEAIQHCEEVSNRERELYRMCPEDCCDGSSDCRELKHGKDKGCIKCAEDHEQLAEWLTQLKRIKEAYKTGEVMNLVAECMSIWGE